MERARRRRFVTEDTATAVVCLAPVIVMLCFFFVYPVLYSAYLSLFEWDGMSPSRTFVGLANYARMLRSHDFWNSFKVTAGYSAGILPGALASGLLAALLLNRRMVLRAAYRALYFAPVITAGVAAAVVWQYLYNADLGVVNRALRIIGVRGPRWLSDPRWALPALIIMAVWKQLGFNMVMFLAGLQAIPAQLYEAARIDGASPWDTFRAVTLPLLGPTFFFVSVMALITSFQVFDQVFVMTRGGPLSSTDVLGVYLHRHAFEFSEMGYGTAVGYAMFVTLFVVTAIQWKVAGAPYSRPLY